MPLHLYRCKACGEEQEVLLRVNQRVPKSRKCKCGKRAVKLLAVPKVRVWEPIFMENVSHEGKYFETRKELKDWCKTHKQEADVLF